MNNQDIISKLKIILSKDDYERVYIAKGGKLFVDTHGLTCADAQRLIKNIIALVRNNLTVHVIHGYNNGHAIKDIIWNKKLSDKKLVLKTYKGNPGVTAITIKAA